MAESRTPSGVVVTREIHSSDDPLRAEISTGGYMRDGSHDHYRRGTSLHAIEDRTGTCHQNLSYAGAWTEVCDGVEIRHRYPDPNDRNSGAWDLRVRRDAAPVYAHILWLEESWCDDSGLFDGTSRSESYVYAIRIDAASPTGPGGPTT
jgi:hypothetical protein